MDDLVCAEDDLLCVITMLRERNVSKTGSGELAREQDNGKWELNLTRPLDPVVTSFPIVSIVPIF